MERFARVLARQCRFYRKTCPPCVEARYMEQLSEARNPWACRKASSGTQVRELLGAWSAAPVKKRLPLLRSFFSRVLFRVSFDLLPSMRFTNQAISPTAADSLTKHQVCAHLYNT